MSSKAQTLPATPPPNPNRVSEDAFNMGQPPFPKHRLWRRLPQPVRSCLWNLLEGDQMWGQIRLLIFTALMMGLVGLSMIMGYRDLSRHLVESDPGPANRLVFFLWDVTRFLLPWGLGAGLAFAVSALYLQDLFQLKWLAAAHYLFSSLFGLWYPRLTLKDGKKEVPEGEKHLLDVIGGPGCLDVSLGNAVLYERTAVVNDQLVGPSSVRGAGEHFLRRFETIRDVFSLEEQYRQRAEIEALTKDGIKLTLRDVEATFRIGLGPFARSPADPFPFLPGNIRRLANDKKAGSSGDWQESVMGTIRVNIVKWISRQNLDAITAPIDEDPRQKLRDAILEDRSTRDEFARMGIELLWVSFGHIDCPLEVDLQRFNNWEARWDSNNKVTRAQAEAFEIAYKALGRAEAQADTLLTITHVLQEATTQLGAGAHDRLGDILLIYMAQILEAMTEPPGLTHEHASQSKPDTSEAQRLLLMPETIKQS